MNYLPGTHIIASLTSSQPHVLDAYQQFRTKVDELVEAYDLKKLGEVYHDFENGGFTAVICLSESHISIHTWPEHNLINLDVYLSNFQRVNDGAVRGIYDALKGYFKASIKQEQIISR